MVAGLILGLAGLTFAYLWRLVVPGRMLMDPLPLALLPNGLLRSLREGFTYFELRSPLLHLFFAIALGSAAAWLIVRRGGTHE